MEGSHGQFQNSFVSILSKRLFREGARCVPCAPPKTAANVFSHERYFGRERRTRNEILIPVWIGVNKQRPISPLQLIGTWTQSIKPPTKPNNWRSSEWTNIYAVECWAVAVAVAVASNILNKNFQSGGNSHFDPTKCLFHSFRRAHMAAVWGQAVPVKSLNYYLFMSVRPCIAACNNDQRKEFRWKLSKRSFVHAELVRCTYYIAHSVRLSCCWNVIHMCRSCVTGLRRFRALTHTNAVRHSQHTTHSSTNIIIIIDVDRISVGNSGHHIICSHAMRGAESEDTP